MKPAPEVGFSPLGAALERRRAPSPPQSRVVQPLEERANLERALRKLSGRLGSMSNASKALGLDVNRIGRILKMGFRITDDLVEKLAVQLGVSVEDLRAGRIP